MKLKKLYIHNIASISEAVIEFDGPILSNEPLFLICGETGSGKTTILDAICLALYNDTPRLSQAIKEAYIDVNGVSITLSNPVQYLRKGTGEGCIHLSFESGEKVYIAKWSIARAYKKADGNFQKIEWTVEDIETGIECKGTEIESIIGMGFEEFRRTVMLAQGEFTAFLKSKNDEKTRILEKITGTGIYKEIGHRVTEHFRNAQKDYDLLNQSISTIESRLLSDESVIALNNAIKAMTSEVNKKQKVRASLEKLKVAKEQEEDVLKENTAHQRKLSEAEVEFSRLSGGLLFAIKTQKEKHNELESLQDFIKQNSSKESIFLDSKLIVKDLTDITSNEESILKKNIEAGIAQNKCKEIESSLKLRKETIEEKEAECNKIKESIEQLSEEKAMLGESRLKSLKMILEKIKNLEDFSAKISKQIDSNEKELQDLNIKVKEQEASYNASVEIYNSANAIFEKMKETNSQWAKDARASLVVGETCPVCGQVIPSKDYLDSISEEHFQSLLAPVKEELETARAQKEALYKAVAATSAESVAITNMLVKQRQDLADNQMELNKFIEIKVAEKHEDISLEQVNERLDNISKLTELIEKHNSNLSKEYNLLNRKKEEYAQINADLTSLTTQIESIHKFTEETSNKNTEILLKIDSKMGGNKWRTQWDAGRRNFLNSLQEAAEKYKTATEKKDRLELTLKSIEETVNTMSAIKNDIIKNNPKFEQISAGDCVVIKGQLELWSLLNSNISTSNAGVVSTERKLKKYHETVVECIKELSNYFIDNNIDSSNLDKNKSQALLADVDQELSKLNEEIGSKRNQIIRDKQEKEQIANDKVELEKLMAIRDKWKALNDVFGKKDGEYFQKIAQGFVMNDILSRANHYLKTITKRYILESQPGSLEILVRDMEQGGITRSTSTISGGESFIISLSLALGLSSLGAGGNIYVDTLFIDEGFGTLSSEYLDTVTETLQKLNETGGKRVGIISHVKELRERIGAKITVSKTNPTESVVTITS